MVLGLGTAPVHRFMCAKGERGCRRPANGCALMSGPAHRPFRRTQGGAAVCLAWPVVHAGTCPQSQLCAVFHHPNSHV